jgi:hypothetical protein
MSTVPTPTTTRKPRIRILSAHRYLVESTSRPGLGHQVDVLRLVRVRSRQVRPALQTLDLGPWL